MGDKAHALFQVAKESAAKFNPHIKLEAHHANIKDSQFNIDWFQGFNIVFNALDNLDARRHVNKMCLAASVPLIESGTTGFNGQVQVIIKVSRPDRLPLSALSQLYRGKLNVTIAIQKRRPKVSLFARSEVLLANQYIA